MRHDEFLEHLGKRGGVLRIEPLDRSTVQEVVRIEESICRVSCGLRLENAGVQTCASCSDLFVMFCTSEFPRPDCVTMEMVDDRGVVIGHDVTERMKYMYLGRDDLVWMSDNFVLYPNKTVPCDVRLVMKASRLEADLPGDVMPWQFYPSPESADLLNSIFGIEDRTISSVLVGVDGLEPRAPWSVPVPDVVEVPCAGRGHGEPASEDPLDGRDLVRELLEVLQLALADEDLHALVVVEVDVDRCVHERLMVVLHVGELVADGCDGVVVNHDNGPDHPLLVVLPLGLRQGVTDQVPDGLRPADISFLGDRVVELFEELGFQGNTDTGHAFHGKVNRAEGF